MSLTPDFPKVDLRMPPDTRLDDDLFFAICQANREFRIERNAKGDIQIMPPTGGETGRKGSELIADLVVWARQDGRGIVFDSSTGFNLPNGAIRSPDAAWVHRERLASLTDKQKRGFMPLAPDFVVELASPADRVEELEDKMREYQANGVRLGWLILPDQRRVMVYRPNADPQRLDNPTELAGDPVLPGFALDVSRLFAPGF
jgi:Uma2 family endonuclease